MHPKLHYPKDVQHKQTHYLNIKIKGENRSLTVIVNNS